MKNFLKIKIFNGRSVFFIKTRVQKGIAFVFRVDEASSQGKERCRINNSRLRIPKTGSKSIPKDHKPPRQRAHKGELRKSEI
ncbi:MAG: hypothetical protein RMI79_04180, partial [Nitrososphaerota archaeon]|nr:hypothetical protein [Nitrososphaerota archaeon]